MDNYTETLHDLTWSELMQQVAAILARDAKTLENNVNYYKKLLGDANADKDQLNRLFEKLQLDKMRYSCFSELFLRLDENKYKLMIVSLENCIQQDTATQNKAPKDWVATVRYEEGELKLYFMALSYHQ